MAGDKEFSYRELVEKLDRANRALSRELAEHKRTEAVLRESEKKYRTLYTASRDAVMLLKPGERFISGNPATLEMFRCRDESEFVSMAPADLSPPHQPDGRPSAEKSREMIDLAVANGSHFFEWTHRRLDGEDFPSTVLLTRMNLGGETVLQATVRDVTRTKEMETRLRQSEKMQAIGQLAGGIAHDFNNRLVSIQGFAQLLKDELKDPRLRDYAQRIVTGAKRAARLTSQLLAFARKGDYRAVPVNIHELITEVLMFLEHTIGKHIRISLALEAEKAVVMGDPSQLQNVLLNLALNARDAMPHGGDLVFSTSLPPEEEIRKAGLEAGADGCIKIQVTDTGIGMSREVREHIFEPFFTTKNPDQGTGMGLASAYGVIQQHGGSIEVESEPGRGSTFTILLPLCRKGNIAAAASDTPTRARRRTRIMVVEDEDDVREFLALSLGKLGYEVTACENGKAALERYRQQWRRIDLVILDMVMPGMNGTATFRAMAGINPAVRAILVTGYEPTERTSAPPAQGICAVMRKPFDLNGLSRVIDRVLHDETSADTPPARVEG